MEEETQYSASVAMSKTLKQVRDYTSKKGIPFIPFQAKQVSIISEPESFYSLILNYIKSTKHRISLSALYLGTGPKENALVQAIYDNLQRNKHLKVNIALDRNRATRPDNEGQSSLTVLTKLSDWDNVRLSLINFNSHSIAAKLLQRIRRWNELISTYHSKMLIFDDDIILTGANLSNIYFEKRQDRYVVIKGCKPLCDYKDTLLSQLDDGRIKPVDLIRGHNQSFIQNWLCNRKSETSDSWVIPLFQHGSSGITEKEDFLRFLESILPEESKVYMSSGYFNPSPVIDALKIDSVLAPSEKSNGFYNGSGLLNYVPRLYSALHKHYMDTHKRCQFFLYKRPDWSFHAKGVWIEGLGDLYIHMVGSSNYNLRSSSRDFEAQFVILTTNRGLIDKLTNERIALWEQSSLVRGQELTGLNSIHRFLALLIKNLL